MPGTVLGTGEYTENQKDIFMQTQSLQCNVYTALR